MISESSSSSPNLSERCKCYEGSRTNSERRKDCGNENTPLPGKDQIILHLTHFSWLYWPKTDCFSECVPMNRNMLLNIPLSPPRRPHHQGGEGVLSHGNRDVASLFPAAYLLNRRIRHIKDKKRREIRSFKPTLISVTVHLSF